MAWGGGWGGGGAMFGGRSSAEGLPFGGIPSELMDEATKLLALEPPHEASTLAFHQQRGVDQESHLARSVAARLAAISLAVAASSGARER